MGEMEEFLRLFLLITAKFGTEEGLQRSEHKIIPS